MRTRDLDDWPLILTGEPAVTRDESKRSWDGRFSDKRHVEATRGILNGVILGILVWVVLGLTISTLF